jgi:hypothetical protein
MEILKSFDWTDILITEGNEGWTDSYPELSDGDFTVGYQIIWVGGADGVKQVKVSVSGNELNLPVEVISQFYPPAGEEATGGNIYPPPEDLAVQSDTGEGVDREVDLIWTAPDTTKIIIRYNVYRDNVQIGIANTEFYPDDTLSDNNAYTYHITAYYEEDVESVPSNSASTGTPFYYPEPQNFIITGYSLGGPNRTVHLAWEAPETELIIMGYIIYKNDLEIGTTAPEVLTFDDIIGTENYTFYVTALYEEDNESGPSNMQTTE